MSRWRNHPSFLHQLVLKVEKSPVCLLLILRFHIPDEKRIIQSVGIILEERDFSYGIMTIFRDGHGIGMDLSVSLLAKMDEIVVLGKNLRGRT